MDRYFDARILPLGTNTFANLPTGHRAGSMQVLEAEIILIQYWHIQ